MARKKPKGTELSVFKGREAKLNRAIFHRLGLEGPQNIYILHKNIRKTRGFRQLHYGNVNKRVRTLEQTGYLKVYEVQTSKSGFQKVIYELTTRAYLALKLNATSLDDLLSRIPEDVAFEILAALSQFL